MKKRVGFFLCACILAVGAAGSSSNTITVRSSGVDGDTVSGGEAKIAITVTAGSTSLLYDGQLHDYHQYIMNNQLAIGDTILVTVEGQAKNIGDIISFEFYRCMIWTVWIMGKRKLLRSSSRRIATVGIQRLESA